MNLLGIQPGSQRGVDVGLNQVANQFLGMLTSNWLLLELTGSRRRNQPGVEYAQNSPESAYNCKNYLTN